MHQCSGDHQSTFHATGQRTGPIVALRPQPKLRQVLFCPCLCKLPLDAVIARLVDRDLPGCFKHIEVELLRHDTQVGLGTREMPVNIDAEDMHLSRALINKGTDDANGCRLSSAIGTQQRKKITFVNRQIDVLKGHRSVSIGFAQALNLKCGCHSGGVRRNSTDMGSPSALCKGRAWDYWRSTHFSYRSLSSPPGS